MTKNAGLGQLPPVVDTPEFNVRYLLEYEVNEDVRRHVVKNVRIAPSGVLEATQVGKAEIYDCDEAECEDEDCAVRHIGSSPSRESQLFLNGHYVLTQLWDK